MMQSVLSVDDIGVNKNEGRQTLPSVLTGGFMKRFGNKENINILANIDNPFGEHEGKIMPWIIVILLAAAPLLIWLFFLINTPIKFWMVVVFDVLWTGRWMLKIPGQEDKKMAFYEQQLADAYKSADEIIHITHVHDDGLIEYDNGRVAYLISGFLKGYINDDALSLDLENFMNELDAWEWDYTLHNVVDELLCENNLPKLARYTDKEVIQDRINFYSYQDEWSRTHTALYRITFIVQAPKYNWKKLKLHLEELISSDIALMFNDVSVLRYDQVNDILNRDICGFTDILTMLTKKYENSEYYASKVMWYDDEVPVSAKVENEEHSEMSKRRVSHDSEG